MLSGVFSKALIWSSERRIVNGSSYNSFSIISQEAVASNCNFGIRNFLTSYLGKLSFFEWSWHIVLFRTAQLLRVIFDKPIKQNLAAEFYIFLNIFLHGLIVFRKIWETLRLLQVLHFSSFQNQLHSPFSQTGIRIASHREKNPFTVGKVGILLNTLEEDLLILLRFLQ